MVVSKGNQSATTRQLLLETAERLFALHGIAAVSNRQISRAAGQGNNYAVGHHFGDKVGLIRAILESHNSRIDEIRARVLAEIGYIAGVREWIDCLIRPEIEHLAALDGPSYYARFCAHLAADPEIGYLLYDSVAVSQSLTEVLTGFYRVLPAMPKPVMDTRLTMSQHMVIHAMADVERTMDGPGAAQSVAAHSWSQHCDMIVDATVGLWLAPNTSRDVR
ncbi:TetR/AcrR family transcriptional regulator [Gordonia insulae]|uniref:HTH-type transcriptional repressor AcnR n=1 Tax=Gordonia insulae TaxID=2420509 RepID=A0A3G8JNB6_9ACTN|nr:TetR family transcriptional regulator [Gordonia insulae]AZG46574.1 HTH-type transcriptional repressor AcnR [Gordonia insulae]